jgi:hypothetical protein
MTVETYAVRNALVYRDNIYTHRWYDAFGENVNKYLQDFTALPADDQTTDPTEWINTVVEIGGGTSTAVVNDLAGGGLIITTAANEDDGWSSQLGNANTGESVLLDGPYLLYLGAEFSMSDATQSDFFLGVAITDTALLGGVSDGMYFRKVDASTSLNFVTEKDSVESTTAIATIAADVYVVAEYLFDGTTVRAYINGVEVASSTNASATFPNDEEMRLSYEFLAGEAVAKTCSMKWLRMIHIR